MSTSDETRRRWAARVCQLDAWSRELQERAQDCDASFEQLDSPSSGAEGVFAGTRDILSFAADRVDQAAAALTMIVELVEVVDPGL